MTEPTNDQAVTVPAEAVPALPTDPNFHRDVFTALKTDAEALVAAIRNDADTAAAGNHDIEQSRSNAKQLCKEFEIELASMRESTATAQKQVEAGKATLAEINNLFSAT